MKSSLLFPSRVLKLALISWQGALESPQVMRSRFNTLILSLTDGVTKEWCIATYLFWRASTKLSSKSGYLFLALYYKQARVCLQRFTAGDSKPSSMAPSVSCTRAGIPRIIPSFHRKKIKEGDLKIIRLYLSLFSLSNLIPLAKKISADLLKSIEDPAPLDAVQEVASEMRPHLGKLLRRYIPGIDSIPLKQGLEFVPTWKSTPSTAWYNKLLRKSGDDKGISLRKYSYHTSIFHCFFSELAAFQMLMTFCHARGEQFSQGCLWPSYTRYAFDRKGNKFITEQSLEWFERRIGPLIPSPEMLGIPPNTGRLCQACTGNGKRRLFAIGNYINQRLLHPIHTWLMKLLIKLPMDGTFNQVSPLLRLRDRPGTFHSVDLKSATDRWPLLLLFEIVQALFDRSFASCVVNSTLAQNIFQVTFLKKAKCKAGVSFIAGQPLGLYGSWPLFALSHHLVIWYCAEQEYPGKVFTDYAVLGDDVLIVDDRVAARYQSFLSRIGVSISPAKSIISERGGCEFAKKFFLNRVRDNVSPLSMKKISVTKHPYGWYNFVVSEYGLGLRLSTLLRIGGLGFKACSRPLSSPKHGKRARRMIVMLLKFLVQKDLSLEIALSVVLGRWISPQEFGRVIHLIITKELLLKELTLPPIEVYPYPGMEGFNEYSLFRGWMKQYLTYLYWYSSLWLSPRITLDHLFTAPVYSSTWYAPKVSLETFRFGLSLRIIDVMIEVSKTKILLLPSSDRIEVPLEC